jgi:hypothetical protein
MLEQPPTRPRDGFQWKIDEMVARVDDAKAKQTYYYQQAVHELDGAWVVTEEGRKLMFATYSYLGLLGHPYINQAAQEAIERYGTGTHGVRLLGGTLDIHLELEKTIARFHGRDDAIVFSSGYVTNLATISAIVGKGDWVISDKWNHASIVDGCTLARGHFVRFRHNDMRDLERRLQQAPEDVDRERLSGVFTYPEWETRSKSYLSDHTRVLASRADITGEIPSFRADPQAMRRIRAVKRQFEALQPGRIYLHGQPDGEELDMDAAVRSYSDLHAYGEGTDRIWRQSRPQRRDLAVSILLDISRSTESAVTGGAVIDIEREALAALA